MTMSENQDFISELFPLFPLLKYLGAALFRVAGPTGRRKISNFPRSYYLVPYVLLAVSGYTFATPLVATKRIFAINIVIWWIAVSHHTAAVFYFATVALSQGYFRGLAMKTYGEILQLDEELAGLSIAAPRRASRRRLHAFLAFQAIMIGVIVVSARHQQWVYALKFVVTFIYKCVIGTNVSFWVYAVAVRFNQVNHYLESQESCRLRDVTRIYAELSSIKKSVNAMCAPVLLVKIALSCSMLTMSGFKIWLHCIYLDYSDASEIAFMLLWVFFHLTPTMILICICHKTVSAASKTKQLLLSLSTTMKDHPNRTEVVAFSLQLLNDKPAITVAEMFKIDYSLIILVVGTISTYLVIAVQFEIMYFQ